MESNQEVDGKKNFPINEREQESSTEIKSDPSPLTNLMYFAPILLILTSLIAFLIKVNSLEAKFSRDVYKFLEDFENAQNQEEEEKKIEEAKALLSVMEAGIGINQWLNKESTVYVLHKIITQVNGSQNEKECKLSSEPLWAVDVNGKQIATGGWTRKVWIWHWDLEKPCPNTNQPSWNKAKDIITSVSFNPQGEKLAVSAGVNVDILKQKAPKSKEWISHYNNTSPISFEAVLDIDFSSDGKKIAIARGEGKVSLWEYSDNIVHDCSNSTGKPLRSVNIHSESSRKWIVAGGEDGSLRLLDFNLSKENNKKCGESDFKQPNGKRKGTQGWIWSVDLHPDGKLFATVGGDGIIRIRNITDLLNDKRGLENKWDSGQSRLTTVNFSPNGERLATAAWDGTVKLWNLSEQPLVEWNAKSPITSLSFIDDENIVTVQLDGTVKFWTMPKLDELIEQGCTWLQSNIKDKDISSSESETLKSIKKRQDKLCKKNK